MNLNQNFELKKMSSAKRGSCNAKQKPHQIKRDKMIVDIDKAGFGNGMMDLKPSKLPGVQLDKDENVFRGNANLQIMIDGKPSLLTG
jgi:hypothetical protein